MEMQLQYMSSSCKWNLSLYDKLDIILNAKFCIPSFSNIVWFEIFLSIIYFLEISKNEIFYIHIIKIIYEDFDPNCIWCKKNTIYDIFRAHCSHCKSILIFNKHGILSM